MNAVTASSAQTTLLSVDDTVASFLHGSCMLQEGAETFIRDLYAAFDAQHPGLLAMNIFSEKLLNICEELALPVKRGTKRRPAGEKTPIANVVGLTLKQ